MQFCDRFEPKKNNFSSKIQSRSITVPREIALEKKNYPNKEIINLSFIK